MKSKLYLGLILLAVGSSRANADAPQLLELSEASRSKCLGVLRDGLRSDEFWPSIHAAEALTLAGQGDEVRAFLESKLPAEEDDQRRCGLARELVRAGDWRKSAIMLDILAGDEPHGHVHAAESLYKVFEIGDGLAMRRAMAQEQNVNMRLMAAAALARCGNSLAMTLLREKLADPDQEIRRIAAWILGRIGDASDIAQLRTNAADASDELAKCYFENSLAALGDPAGLQSLHVNLASDDPAVRTYAATFAGDARALDVADRLQELLDDENLDVRIRSAQSLLVISRPAPQNPQEDISRLVYAATDEHPRYTEGSIIRLADGDLLYAATEFFGSGSDFARAHIVGRRSSDGGRNWSAPEVLQETTGKLNVMSVTMRRLAPPHADTIGMFFLQKNSFTDLRAYVRYSQDEAESFGEPILVTTEPGYHVMNNDRVVQLSSGRLLAPVASTSDVQKVNHFVSYCFLSDDQGQTWRKGKGHIDQPKRGAMEPEVIELEDGRVLMIVRNQLGYIAASRSRDGGDTWDEPTRLSTLIAPEAPATLRRVPATGDLLLIWNNTYQAGSGHGGQRTPLTAAVSSDEGRTWRHVRNLETDKTRTYSYTSLIFVQDRAVMSYWEGEGSRLSSRFRSLPVSWFYADDSGQPE
jgi:sialidase-1